MAQTIIVDTTPGYRMPTIYYSQGDIGRTFSIDLQSRFGDSLPASPTITIQATKPSGLGFSVASTSISGAVVTFTVTETMSNEAGRFPAELKIVKNSVTLFTANFYIDCEANAHPEGTTDGDLDSISPKFMSVTTTTLPAGDSATYSYDPETNTATFGIPKGADGSLASQVLAADYSSSKTYAVGDYVYYSGNLYRCTTAITTAEAWTAAHWSQVALANDVSDLKDEINELEGGTRTYTKAQAIQAFTKAKKNGATYVLLQISIGSAVDFGFSADAYTLIIPCKNYKSITYPLFKTTGINGSGFSDENGVVIAGYNDTTEDTGTIKKVEVPLNAENFYLSISSALDAFDWQVTFETRSSVASLQEETNETISHIEISAIINGRYFTTNGSTFNWAYTQDPTYGCTYLECKEGDLFKITGSSGSSPRLWAFVDDSNNILSKADASTSVTDLEIIAPAGTKYAVFNVHTNATWSIYKGLTLEERIAKQISATVDEYVEKNQGIAKAGRYLYVDENGLVSTTNIINGNSESIYDGYLLSLNSAEAVPTGESALSYADFISTTWDTLLSAFPNEVTKTTVINDSSNTYPIYKYVFTPEYYKKTVFLTAGMHGDEYEGFWGLYRFVNLLYTEGYKYSNLRKFRHDVRLIVIPVLNPYGVQNKQRANSQNMDANQNYDVYWSDPNYIHQGSSPFMANEAKAVKLVADEYSGEINYFADFHTDPYAPMYGLYIEAQADSPTYETAYNLTLDYRQVLKDEYNYSAPLSQNFVVMETNKSNSYSYMEEVQNVPSNIIEVGTGGFSTIGSADTMKTGTDWYANVVTNMLAEGLII